MKMTGNTILITGGGSGIGLGLAAAFHQRGNQVIIAGRREEIVRQAAAPFPGMVWRVLDQRDPMAINAFVAQLTQDYPTLNVLINNAGIQRREDLTQVDPQQITDTVSTNLLGPLWLTGALIPHLLRQPHATIVNVTSGTGIFAAGDYSNLLCQQSSVARLHPSVALPTASDIGTSHRDYPALGANRVAGRSGV
ncbi:SDR family NAD(P)-dependent oxidoreductase [Dickeya poaceiphila]|uniref:SDR family NAD(P)-dependent oxidoreductase n=1 Tax=Dickeya poaceiphila TaxID=568768 RepID=UPI0003A9FA89